MAARKPLTLISGLARLLDTAADWLDCSVTKLLNGRTSTGVSYWSGTQAQYDALGSWDANTLYDITDAVDPTDPWTYVKLTADISTTGTTPIDVGLAFTPGANTSYEFEACLYCRTATAANALQAGLAWATGLTDGVAEIRMPSTAVAETAVFGNSNASLLCQVASLPNNTQSWPARYRGDAIAGSSPSGTIKLQFKSEVSGTQVTVKAGSWLKYRVR